MTQNVYNMTETGYFLKKISSGENIPLAPVMSIGRSEDSALRLVEGQPSRHHARLSSDPNSVFIEDLGSTNGTFVNGQRLDAGVKRKLMAGDRVRFDTEEFEFVAPAAKPPIDADKTVFRAPVAEKTVFRTPEPPNVASSEIARRTAVEPRRTTGEAAAARNGAPPAPRAIEKPAPVNPAPAKQADPSGKADLPGAFMDPSNKKTVFIDPKQPKSVKNSAAAATLAVVDTPCLWVASGEHAGQKIELRPGISSRAVWSIGSGEDRDIRLQDPGVSAVHATLRNKGRTWQLTDDVSANGTFVNDRKVLDSFLSNGDKVRLGPVECVFRSPPAGAERGRSGRWRKVVITVAIAFVVTLAVLYALKLL